MITEQISISVCRFFRSALAAARANLTNFTKDLQFFDLNVSPAQRSVRDQAYAFVKILAREWHNEVLTAASLREGIENLYFLGHFWKGDEVVARVSIFLHQHVGATNTFSFIYYCVVLIVK